MIMQRRATRSMSRLSLSILSILLLVLENGQGFLYPLGPKVMDSRYGTKTMIIPAGSYISRGLFSASSSSSTSRLSQIILQANQRGGSSADVASPPSNKMGGGKSKLAADFERVAIDGLISLDAFKQTGEVSELLKDKLLAQAEIEDFWCREAGDKQELLDMEAYLKVHARIDALFEEDEEEEEEEVHVVAAAAAVKQGDITLKSFMASSDVARYLEEDLVTQEEVVTIWTQVAGGDEVVIDRMMSMEVYRKIEELLEDVEEEEEEDDEVISGEDAELMEDFRSYENQEGMMDFSGFLKAGDLPDLLAEGLVSKEELRTIWADACRELEEKRMVDFDGYKRAMQAVDELFVEEGGDDEEGEEEIEVVEVSSMPSQAGSSRTSSSTLMDGDDQDKVGQSNKIQITGPAKPQLMQALAAVPDLIGWLEEDKAFDEKIIAILEALNSENAPTNLAVQDDLELEILEKAMEGEWELQYTTSRTMRYNRGLSGLGKSLPNAEFLGFTQSIVVNGYAYETVYMEKLKTLGRELDVVVEGAWELRDVVSIMDGEMCLIMDVLPATIKYGFITERLETGWKGVRVLNRCELLYLDEEIRVMKGQSSDSYFVFRRRRR